MNADPELDAAVGLHASIAVDKAALHLNRAAHRVDHATKLNDRAVPRALDDAPTMRGDGRIDQIAAQAPQPSERALLKNAVTTRP